MIRSFFPGMALRPVAYHVGGNRIGVLPDVLSMTVTCPRNQTATLSMSYAPGSNAIRGNLLEEEIEVAIEATYDGRDWQELPDSRFVTQKTEQNLVNNGTDDRSVNAIHVSDYTKEALIWEVPEGSADKEGKFKFLSRNAGQILRTAWDAAVKRGWGRGLTLDCTVDRDSANQPWAKIVTLYFDPSISILQILEALRDLGLIDVTWQGRTLKVYNADSSQARDLTSSVRWPLATTLTGAPEAKTWSEMCTDVLVKGEGGRTWRIHNDQAPTSMRRVERVVDAGGVELEATARLVAEATLKSGAHASEEIKREWKSTDVHLLPWLDYRLGDWIMVERLRGMEKLQVVQISITQDGNGVVGHTTFGTVLDSLLGRLTKRTKGIVGLATTPTGQRPTPEVKKNWPRKPTGLVVNSRAVIQANGYPAAVASLSWGPVTTDTENVAVEVTGYEIAVWEEGANAGPSYTTRSNQAQVGPFAPGSVQRFWVRATNNDGVGNWSDEVKVTMASDAEPPPVPSAPILNQTLGVLNIFWDNKGARNENMPLDFAGIEISVQHPGRPAAKVTDMPSPMQRTALAGLEIRDYEVKFRSVDRAGNKSDWSQGSVIELAQNIDADAIVKQVEAKLAGSDAMQKAAREGTLKEMKHLTEAMTQVAISLVDAGPIPPDSGKIGASIWAAPDGRVFVLRAEGDK
jgi:hypothetical protein